MREREREREREGGREGGRDRERGGGRERFVCVSIVCPTVIIIASGGRSLKHGTPQVSVHYIIL